MVTLTEHTTVREVVVNHPQTRAVLEQRGVDYCCGGGQPLKEAAAEAGVALDALLADLRQTIATPPPGAPAEPDWSQATVTELVHHIEQRHHAFTKQQLPRLEGLLARVLKAHGARHGEALAELQKVYRALKADLDLHLLKEEQVLFPHLRALDAPAEGPRPALACGSAAGPIRQMRLEHEEAGAALAALRDLTSGYALPPDACQSFRALYDGLRALEADLHEHIHLENNILFPRALEHEPIPSLP